MTIRPNITSSAFAGYAYAFSYRAWRFS
jgi:hypothetical protein